MLHILFDGLVKEEEPHKHRVPWKKEGKSTDVSWQEWRALRLVDVDSNTPVAEWFYVVACDKKTYDSLPREEDKSPYLVMEKYSENNLLKFTKDKLNKLQFSDWGDFYKKMSVEFVWEDS